jgi:hypothetical protein
MLSGFTQFCNVLSLGEVYLIVANKVLAKENYKKSLALNPTNEGAKKALALLNN